MRAKLLGAALAVVLAPFAMCVSWAADPPRTGHIVSSAPAMADEPARWTGFHAGAAVGYGWLRSEFDSWSSGEGTVNVDSALATVGVGWDMQMSNMVLGLMADVTASDLTSDAVHWQWFVGARAGVLLTPKTLGYVLAGYTETIDGNLAFKLIESTKLSDIAGLTVGGGLEHMFAQGWSARAEYRYVSFGSETAPDGVADGLVDGSSIDTGEHQVRLGVVRRF